MLARNLFELGAVVDTGFVTRAIDQPEVVSAVARLVSEEPVQHPANRRNTCAGRDKDRIAQWLADREHPVRTVPGDRGTGFKVAEIIRHKSVLHAVQTEVEGAVTARRRG